MKLSIILSLIALAGCAPLTPQQAQAMSENMRFQQECSNAVTKRKCGRSKRTVRFIGSKRSVSLASSAIRCTPTATDLTFSPRQLT
jgi:hypothetical protein